ncbi:MAG: condensation domain-containing protein [Halieaceae bacterium]|jgi:NRPS condensation-like uncharacterized protein|nr:condensation domain-containing protein [Halieaceae bacterium]
MKAAPTLDRPLGRTEHIYWLLDQLYCLNFVAFAEVEGSLEEADLLSALTVVQRENPVLRTRIVVDGDNRPRFEPVSQSERPLRLDICSLRNWRRQIDTQLMKAFDPDREPLARFQWYRGKGRRSVVAMVFHHAIADGKSGAAVLLDVLRRACGDDSPAVLKPARPSSQQLDMASARKPVESKLKELRFWLDTGKKVLKFPEQLPGYDMESRPGRKIRSIPFNLPTTASRNLAAACRKHETTIHGALGASLLLAINAEFEREKPRHLGLNSLADLRGVLSGGLTEQDLGLYISTLTTVHRLETTPKFWRLAREIPEQLRSIMDSGDANAINGIYTEISLFSPDLAGARRVQKIVALAAPSSMLTNIGRIAEVPLGDNLKIRSLAFAVSPPAQHPVCVTAASYGGQMCLNLLYDECKIESAQASRMADAMLARLQEAGGKH